MQSHSLRYESANSLRLRLKIGAQIEPMISGGEKGDSLTSGPHEYSKIGPEKLSTDLQAETVELLNNGICALDVSASN